MAAFFYALSAQNGVAGSRLTLGSWLRHHLRGEAFPVAIVSLEPGKGSENGTFSQGCWGKELTFQPNLLKAHLP